MKTIYLSEYKTAGDMVVNPDYAVHARTEIEEELRSGGTIAVSFKDTDRVIAAFLKIMLGELYNPDKGLADAADRIQVVDADPVRERQVEEIKKYSRMSYEDPERLARILEED